VKTRIAAVIPARNEELHIGKTLSALLKQDVAPNKIIVINDGSTDSTEKVASSMGAEVINITDRGYDAQGTPALANVLNYGLQRLQESHGFGSNNRSDDYVLILGADHILPSNYIKAILDLMEADNLIAICSGQIKGEKKSLVPRGSGRIIRVDFWSKIGFRYPENYGFEAYLIIRANQYGYKIKVMDDLVSEILRKAGRGYKKNTYISYGKSLKALGYNKAYAAARISLQFPRNPRGAIYMMKGYLSRDVKVYEQEFCQYLSRLQRTDIRHYILNPSKILKTTRSRVE
jgi:glycosyltransferase involved in cell wall biosynthesis